MSLKKIICLFLCICMLLPVLVGCNDQPQQTQTTGTTDPTGSAQKTDTLRILIIGNSHSLDTFQFLAEAFRDQLPEQNIVAASLYYSGCSITQHNTFAATQEPVYRFTMNKNGKVTGNKITAINMDEIPVAKRHEQYQSLGNLTITDEMKQVIMEAAISTPS